jgi:hypothetical protein
MQQEGAQDSLLDCQQQYRLIPQPHQPLVIHMFRKKWLGCQDTASMTPQELYFVHEFLKNLARTGEPFASMSMLITLIQGADDEEGAVEKGVSKIRIKVNRVCGHSFKISRLNGGRYFVEAFEDCVIIPYPGIRIIPSLNMQAYPLDLYDFELDLGELNPDELSRKKAHIYKE